MTVTETMSEYDLLELVAFDHKADYEGLDYAAENYPPRFERDGLRPTTSMDALAAPLREHREWLEAFWAREDACDVHNAHVDAARKRLEDSRLWGARSANGNVITCDD